MERTTYASTVTSKGQVTIPKAVRDRLGLKQGDGIDFVTENGRTFVRRVRKAGNPFRKYAGALGKFEGGLKGINAWIDDMRGTTRD